MALESHFSMRDFDCSTVSAIVLPS